jgi:hypothetical protein
MPQLDFSGQRDVYRLIHEIRAQRPEPLGSTALLAAAIFVLTRHLAQDERTGIALLLNELADSVLLGDEELNARLN